MSTVLEEVAGAVPLDREYIQQRVDDWARRVDELFARVRQWLPAGFEVRERSRTMDEKLMREFGVASRSLPILDIHSAGRAVATLEPRGLWIIGANGRVDLVTETDHFMLVDESESFAAPQWRISRLRDRERREPLDRDRFRAALTHEAPR